MMDLDNLSPRDIQLFLDTNVQANAPIRAATAEYVRGRLQFLVGILMEPNLTARDAYSDLGNDDTLRGRISELKELLAIFSDIAEQTDAE